MSIESPRHDWFRRATRTLVQLIAGGSLYALTDQIAKDVPDAYAPYIIILYSVLVAAAQNYAEDAGWIPAVGKAVASSGDKPVPEPEPSPDVDWHNPDTWPSTPKGASRRPDGPTV